METVSVSGSEEKVYRFDERKYPKVYIPRLILTLGIFIIYAVAYILLNHFLFEDRSIMYMLISLVVVIAWLAVHFFRNRSFVRNSFIEIGCNKEAFFTYKTYRVSNEATFSVNRIEKVKRTRFSLIVRGSIESSTIYYSDKGVPVAGGQKRLRIPAYFEGMDEIYAALERMNEEPYE